MRRAGPPLTDGVSRYVGAHIDVSICQEVALCVPFTEEWAPGRQRRTSLYVYETPNETIFLFWDYIEQVG